MQKDFLFRLWNEEYPRRLSFNALSDLDTYLDGLKDPIHYLAEAANKRYLGWACVFERGDETWFAMILDGTVHRQGIGSTLLQLLKENENTLNGWAIDHARDIKPDGNPYSSPIDFYKKNHFTICTDTRLETEKLSAVKITWNSGHQD